MKNAFRGSRLLRCLATLSVLLGLAAVPNTASACCSAPWIQQIVSQTLTSLGTMSTNVTNSITTSTYYLQNAILGSAQSQVGAIEKQMASDKELSQARLNFRAASETQERFAAAQDRFNAPSSYPYQVCQTMASGVASVSAGDDALVNGKALTRSDTQRTAFTPSSSDAAKVVMDDYRANYCSPQDAARRRCTAVADVNMQGAAISADTLLTPASNETYSPQEIRAAQAFVTMVTNPVPDEMGSAALDRGNTAVGKRFRLEQMSSAARMSMAQHSLNQILTSKAASPDMVNTQAGTASGDLSMVGRMKEFVEKRFGDPKYRESLVQMDVKGHVAELNHQMAATNWMDYFSYLQNERIEASLATSLAMTARDRAERQLAAARVMTTSRR